MYENNSKIVAVLIIWYVLLYLVSKMFCFFHSFNGFNLFRNLLNGSSHD